MGSRACGPFPGLPRTDDATAGYALVGRGNLYDVDSRPAMVCSPALGKVLTTTDAGESPLAAKPLLRRCPDTASCVDRAFLNPNAILPYNVTPDQIYSAMVKTCSFLDAINSFLRDRGYPNLQDLILGNSFSGLISELLVRHIAECCPTLARNRYVGGHPDLLPLGLYPNDSVLKGNEGIEIKTSRQAGGWQGHNPEDVHIMVFRYTLDGGEFRFVEVLAAKLTKNDWSFSGRKGASRRTPTASITASGVEKLRANPIYRDPAYAIATTNRTLRRRPKKTDLPRS